MSEKLLVKYLSPETGEYEYASVIDIGDLDNLKTSVKTDLVSAINSITLSGEVPANIQSQIDEVNTEITSLKNAGLTQNQIDEIQAKIDVNIIDIIGQVNIINDKTKEDFDKEIKDLSDSFDGKLATTENDYNTKVSEINLNLSNAKQDIDETKTELENAGARLNNIDLNYVTVTQNIDRIDGELTTKVNSTDFDLMQAKVTENTTQISQTKDEIQTLATKTSLDLVTERITKAESDIHINADGISSRVTYQEMNTELQKVSKYGDNLLTGTRNWDDRWKPSNVAYTSISSDTYNHCRIQVVTNELGYYYTPVDNLEVGETYTASIYYKSKDDSQLTNIVLDDENDEYQLDTIVENTSTINGWRRVSVSFVPIEKSPTVAFKFGFLAGTDIGYLAGAKIELGVKASEWKPHYNDDNESILKNESSIKQNSESIVTLVTKTERMDGDITDNRTQISQTAEDVSLQATKITEIDGKVSENTASLVVANDAINTKVSQTDVDESIASINLDTKNRILNSDFSREWNDWSEKNDGYSIQKIDGVNFAHISRTGLTNVSIASVASAKFQVSNNEKLNFSFMFMADPVSGLDDKNIFTIELFDISDVRVMSKTFNTSELEIFPTLYDGKVSKLSGKYVVNRSDVAKARIKIQLNKNGSVYFSKIYLQKGDVKESEWSVAPEDLELYRTEMQTEINQNSEKIELRATKTEMDEANRSIQQNTADIVLSNGKIEQIVTDYTAINGRVSQAESSITQNANAITQKVSSTDVENILTEKSYATQSQLTQDLDGFKTTVSNTYLSKSDASDTYADKVSVTSQINQSATQVTQNIQSWTNGQLNSYSTIQSTDSSIASAVADKADKSQITQLSDSINLKVSKGDVVSSINQEAGQILFNSNKLVLNANTTEIAGDAFIRGNMIVDKSITAEKIEVDTLASISANIGDIRAGSITGISILSSSIANVYDFDYNGVRHSGLVTLKDGFNVEDFAEISGKTKYGKVNMIGGGYNTGLNIQEYPDVEDTNSFKMVWVTAGGIYFQDNINNFGGSITSENTTYVPWKNLILNSGYKAGDGVQPQYRRIKNLDGSYSVQFRGAISPTSGNFPTTQVQVATLSGVYLPPTIAMRQGSDNTGKGGRVAVTQEGKFYIWAPNTSSYVYIDALTYIN